MSFYKAGIDIGSTTIKFVVMDENNNICFKDYRRHLIKYTGNFTWSCKRC